jgi:hypothetical protein
MYVVCLVYLTLLHLSAVQISHHEVEHGYTERVTARGLSLRTVGVKLLENNYDYYSVCVSMSFVIVAVLDSRNV